MIPKIIHYCWFGGNSKPEIVRNCIDSWRRLCPDFEIIEWTEENWDVGFCRYTQEAFNEKKWAFVSDVARLEVINRFGGVYLDTDVELIKPLDSLLECDAYIGFENPNGFNTGIGFGSVKNHFLINELLLDYKERPFRIPGKKRLDVCTKIQTKTIRRMFPELIMNGKYQIIRGVHFLPEDYLNPFTGITDRTISIHHSSLSWMDANDRALKEEYTKHHNGKKKTVILALRNPERAIWIEKHFGKKAGYINMFLTYDLMDYGVVYFAKKAARKIKRIIKL